MAAFGAVPKELKIKEKQDKLLKQQLEKERENQLLAEIEKTEKERIKKRGKPHPTLCATHFPITLSNRHLVIL